MPTLDELEKWCYQKADSQYVNIIAIGDKRAGVSIEERQQGVKMVAKMLKEAYEYGFSQGAGANGNQNV